MNILIRNEKNLNNLQIVISSTAARSGSVYNIRIQFWIQESQKYTSVSVPPQALMRIRIRIQSFILMLIRIQIPDS